MAYIVRVIAKKGKKKQYRTAPSKVTGRIAVLDTKKDALKKQAILRRRIKTWKAKSGGVKGASYKTKIIKV